MGRTKDARGATARMTEYLRDVLGPVLGLSGGIGRVEWPERGKRSDVVLVYPPDAPPFALRWFANRRAASRIALLSRYARACGLPTPRLRHVDAGFAHRRRFGFSVIVEELIAGRHLEARETGETSLCALGRALARIHAIEADRWGPAGLSRGGDFFRNHIQARIENRLASVRQNNPEFSAAELKRVRAFVAHYHRTWDGGPPFALTHDKINPGNVIFTAEGAVRFVDLETLSFGAPGPDFAAALYYFCADEAAERILKEAYFEALPAARRDHFERFEPLYRMWLHLGRWAAKTHKRREEEDAKRPPSATASHQREREAMFAWIERGGTAA